MYIPQIRFSETSKLQNDLISNGYGSSRALEVALNVKSTLERMTEADFKKMETATLQFRPYFEAEKDALIKCTNISKEVIFFLTKIIKNSMFSWKKQNIQNKNSYIIKIYKSKKKQ